MSSEPKPALVVDDRVSPLRLEDIPGLGWSGDSVHLESMVDEMRRVERGDAAYLVLRDADGAVIAKAAIDFVAEPGVGVIWQVATRPELRGQGLGTILIRAAEAAIAAHGLGTSRLDVEVDNPRARALYERLGYRVRAQRRTGWDAILEDGRRGRFDTTVDELVRDLGV